MRLLKDKQQQLANVLDDKQKNLQGLQEEVESKNSLLDELSRKKQEVNKFHYLSILNKTESLLTWNTLITDSQLFFFLIFAYISVHNYWVKINPI